MALDALATAAYLDRIGFTGVVRRDVETLERLQRAHMTAVPFENLHVFHRRGVSTSIEWSVPKVVSRGRGGWCFELNGAFGALLEALGFEVTRLAALVLLGEEPPEAPSHLTLRVDLEVPYLIDVGFGDSFMRPLRLDTDHSQDGGDLPYRLVRRDGFHLLEALEGDKWSPRFKFTDASHQMADFDTPSHYLQTEPGLRWTESPFVTRLLDGGPDRVWLLRDRIKLRKNGVVSVEPIANELWADALEQWFGMEP